jgi:hypothetical protein
MFKLPVYNILLWQPWQMNPSGCDKNTENKEDSTGIKQAVSQEVKLTDFILALAGIHLDPLTFHSLAYEIGTAKEKIYNIRRRGAGRGEEGKGERWRG